MNDITALSADPLAGFEVRWVFGKLTDSLRQQIVSFWLEEGAISNADEAWRRSWEVACVLVHRQSSNLAGACTVAIRLDDQGQSYGFVRAFTRPGNRLAGLAERLMKRMIEGFEEMAHEPGAPQRLIATIENRKLERRAGQKILGRLGFVNAGTSAAGEMVIHRRLRSH